MNKVEKLKEILPDIPQAHGDLKKEGATSLCGPCPKCGGVDRFVFKTDSNCFWCRHCYPEDKPGDKIGFHMWIEGLDFEGLAKKYLPDPESFEHYQLGLPVEKYPYTDAKGKCLRWNCRFENPKTFRQCTADGLTWTVKNIKKVPYLLPKVIKSQSVFIVEGEKDCHTLARLNLVGTCNVAGAGKWTKDLNQYFKDKEIILLPDRDEPGRRHMEKVYSELKDIVASIKWIDLPGLPDGGDVTDWINTFSDMDEAAESLAVMVENAGPYEPDKNETEKEDNPKIEIVSLDSIAAAEVQDKPIINGLIGEKESLIVSGPSGAGKSQLVTTMALTLGNPPDNGLWGLFAATNTVKTLIVQSENGFNPFNKRLNKLFDAHPEMRAGAKNVFTTKIGDDCRLIGSLTDKDFQKILIDSLLSIEAGLLILDPLISYHGEDENDNAAMRRSLDCLTLICDQANVSVILCHHYNRQNLTRGAASIRDWTANMLLMDIEKQISGSTILKITHDKSRNYEQQPAFYLERTSNLQFLRCEKPDGKQSKQIEAVINALTEIGGQVDSQMHLKSAVMVELNCGEATARRAINQALEAKKIIIIPGKGKGNPNVYKLPE